MKGSIVDKWQRMFEISEHTEKLQEIIPNVENVTKYRGKRKKIYQVYKSKKEGKAQKLIQSSTTPDPGYQWESDNFTIRLHNREQRGQPFLSR